MKKVLAIVLLTVFFVGSQLQAQDAAKPELRTWKDSTGQFSVEAVFVRVSGDQVVLQRKDKTKISIPLAKLSVADRQYVQKRLTPTPAGKSEQEAFEALQKLGATIKKDANGHVTEVSFFKNQELTDADLRHLIDLDHLTVLKLQITPVTGVGLEHLKGMKNLKELNLGSTRITSVDLRHLKGLISLEKLNLMNNKTRITGAGLIHLQDLTNLKRLVLADTEIGDAGLAHLKLLVGLERLDLRGTNTTDAGLKHLQGVKNLKELYLWSTKITDAGLVHLKGMEKLRFVSLKFTPVSDAAVAELKQALPNCKIEQ
jgi:Leucine-rich repeat (LRR) protein